MQKTMQRQSVGSPRLEGGQRQVDKQHLTFAKPLQACHQSTGGRRGQYLSLEGALRDKAGVFQLAQQVAAVGFKAVCLDGSRR